MDHEKYTVFQGGDTKQPIIGMINLFYKNFDAKPLYPWFVRVVVEVRNPDEFGLPNTQEIERLNALEDRILNTIFSDANVIYVGHYTYDKMRTIMFYTKTKIEPGVITEHLKQEKADVFLQLDPSWSEVQTFFDQLKNDL